MNKDGVSFPDHGIQQQERWLSQARRQGLGRWEAVARSSRLLRELDAYLVRRRWRRYHTDFDDLLEALLPGLALALELLTATGNPLVDEGRPD